MCINVISRISKDYISELAEFLKGIIDKDFQGDNKLINLKYVAEQLGGELELNQKIEQKACLKKEISGRFKIVLNNKFSEALQRFCFFHEIGHLVLHWNYWSEDKIEWERLKPGIIEKYNGLWPSVDAEIQANYFAECLLLPEGEFLATVDDNSEYDKSFRAYWPDIKNIASSFGVSYNVAAKRGRDLGLWI